MSTFDEALQRYKMSTTPEEQAIRQFRLELNLSEISGFILSRCQVYRAQLVEAGAITDPAALDIAVAHYSGFLWAQAAQAVQQ